MVTHTLATLRRAEEGLQSRIAALDYQLEKYPTSTRNKSETARYRMILVNELTRIRKHQLHLQK